MLSPKDMESLCPVGLPTFGQSTSVTSTAWLVSAPTNGVGGGAQVILLCGWLKIWLYFLNEELPYGDHTLRPYQPSQPLSAIRLVFSFPLVFCVLFLRCFYIWRWKGCDLLTPWNPNPYVNSFNSCNILGTLVSFHCGYNNRKHSTFKQYKLITSSFL